MTDQTLADKVAEKVLAEIDKKKKVKVKKFKLPLKARVSKRKLKDGYITVMVGRDNKNVDFVKAKMEDGTYKLDGESYHTTDEDSILSYKGKPLIVQPKKGLNPINILKGNNETYGHKYIMAKMKTDLIKPKKGGAKVLIWIVVIAIVGYVLMKGV